MIDTMAECPVQGKSEFAESLTPDELDGYERLRALARAVTAWTGPNLDEFRPPTDEDAEDGSEDLVARYRAIEWALDTGVRMLKSYELTVWTDDQARGLIVWAALRGEYLSFDGDDLEPDYFLWSEGLTAALVADDPVLALAQLLLPAVREHLAEMEAEPEHERRMWAHIEKIAPLYASRRTPPRQPLLLLLSRIRGRRPRRGGHRRNGARGSPGRSSGDDPDPPSRPLAVAPRVTAA